MTADKELRKMNRTELIEIIYALQQNERSLRNENEKLQIKLHDKMIRLSRSGSIAEAALDLNRIFEDAQQAAQQYLDSLREKDARALQVISDAERKADEIIAAAEEQAKETDDECRAKREKTSQDIQRQLDAFAAGIRRTMERHPELAAHMREGSGL